MVQGKKSDARMPLVVMATKMSLEMGSLVRASFLGCLHHVDVDGNFFRLFEVPLHVGHDLDSINGMADFTAFAEMLHEFKGCHFGVKRLQVFQFSILHPVDVHGEEAHDARLFRLVEVVVLFVG